MDKAFPYFHTVFSALELLFFMLVFRNFKCFDILPVSVGRSGVTGCLIFCTQRLARLTQKRPVMIHSAITEAFGISCKAKEENGLISAVFHHP